MSCHSLVVAQTDLANTESKEEKSPLGQTHISRDKYRKYRDDNPRGQTHISRGLLLRAVCTKGLPWCGQPGNLEIEHATRPNLELVQPAGAWLISGAELGNTSAGEPTLKMSVRMRWGPFALWKM